MLCKCVCYVDRRRALQTSVQVAPVMHMYARICALCRQSIMHGKHAGKSCGSMSGVGRLSANKSNNVKSRSNTYVPFIPQKGLKPLSPYHALPCICIHSFITICLTIKPQNIVKIPQTITIASGRQTSSTRGQI